MLFTIAPRHRIPYDVRTRISMEHAAAGDLTAFVLTGGKSSRMGRDKAALSLADGESLLEHALAVCAAVAPEVRIVGSRARYAQHAWAGQIVEDIFPDRGPLGGIHAALKSSATELNLVVGVDMPLVTTELLEYLAKRARKTQAVVTVARLGERYQPLCAVYRRTFAEVAEGALREGRNKIDALFGGAITVDVIEESELGEAGYRVELFANVNTPEEYEQLRQGNAIT